MMVMVKTGEGERREKVKRELGKVEKEKALAPPTTTTIKEEAGVQEVTREVAGEALTTQTGEVPGGRTTTTRITTTLTPQAEARETVTTTPVVTVDPARETAMVEAVTRTTPTESQTPTRTQTQVTAPQATPTPTTTKTEELEPGIQGVKEVPAPSPRASWVVCFGRRIKVLQH